MLPSLKTITMLLVPWLALMSSGTLAQTPSLSHGSKPVAMDYHSVGEWAVSPAGGMVVLTLECGAFTNQTGDNEVAAATLRLTPFSTSGAVTGNVLVPTDSTDAQNGQSVARVSVAVAGQGLATFQLEASIDSQEFHAAGSYQTTVAATLSAP